MQDNRRSLAGEEEIYINLRDVKTHLPAQFLIRGEQGRGSSCIVYQAFLCAGHKPERPVLLKEFYPLECSDLLLRSDGDHALRYAQEYPPLTQADEYVRKKTLFCQICENQKVFYLINAAVSADELVEIQGMYVLGESCYAVMPIGGGCSWDQIDREGESLHEVLETIYSVLSELELYHSNELLHGDIKPANIYIFRKTRQHVRLLDFGSTQKLQGGRLTGDEALSYSMCYAAPELLEAEGVCDLDREDYFSCITPKADLYSAAAVLYERLTGQWRDYRMPDGQFFSLMEENLESLWEREKNGWFQNIRRMIVTELKVFLRRTLERNPEDRYSLLEMKKEIERMLKLAEPPRFELAPEFRAYDACADFIGRKSELEQLKNMLGRNQHAVFIYGEGGLGKSELAMKLAQELKSDFDFYRLTFSEDLKQTILGIRTKPEPVFDHFGASGENRTEELYEWNLQCLRGCSPASVLIIDNFDIPPEKENEIFHSRAYADLMSIDMKTLFTSRQRPMPGAAGLELKELPESELLKIIQAYYKGKIDEDVFCELIRKAQSNTLVVELIAKSLEQSWGQLSPKELLRLFSLSGESGDGRKPELIYGCIHHLFQVTLLSDAAKELMAQTILFPAGGITAEICLRCHSQTEQDKLRLLELNGWIHKTPDNLLTVHPLVQEVCRRDLKEQEEACGRFLRNYELLSLTLANEARLKNQYQFADIFSNASDYLSDPEGDYAAKAGGLNYQTGRYRQALKYHQRHWERYAAGKDIDSLKAIGILDCIASCYLGLGQYREAVYYEQQGIHTFEELEGRDAALLADYYNNLGTIYKEYGRFEEALANYQRTQQFYEAREEGLTMQRAGLYLNLCKLYEKLGRFALSKEYGLKALAYYEQYPEKYIPIAVLRASVYTTLGILEEHGNDYQQAAFYYERAAGIYEAAYGRENPWTAGSYNDKGIALTYLGEYDEAFKELTKAKKIKEAVYGSFHTSTANTYHSLSDFYRQKKDYKNALKWCVKAEKIRKASYGPRNLRTVRSYELHAAVLYEWGIDLKKALAYISFAFLIYFDAVQKKLCAESQIRFVQYNLYQIYLAVGNPPEMFTEWVVGERAKLMDGWFERNL